MNAKSRSIIDIAKQDLLNRGVNSSFVCPPFTRLYWAIGIPIRPPIAMSLVFYFIWCTLDFGTGIAIFGMIFFSRSFLILMLVIPIGSIYFAARMTRLLAKERRRTNPPPWEHYVRLQESVCKNKGQLFFP